MILGVPILKHFRVNKFFITLISEETLEMGGGGGVIPQRNGLWKKECLKVSKYVK